MEEKLEQLTGTIEELRKSIIELKSECNLNGRDETLAKLIKKLTESIDGLNTTISDWSPQ